MVAAIYKYNTTIMERLLLYISIILQYYASGEMLLHNVEAKIMNEHEQGHRL